MVFQWKFKIDLPIMFFAVLILALYTFANNKYICHVLFRYVVSSLLDMLLEYHLFNDVKRCLVWAGVGSVPYKDLKCWRNEKSLFDNFGYTTNEQMSWKDTVPKMTQAIRKESFFSWTCLLQTTECIRIKKSEKWHCSEKDTSNSKIVIFFSKVFITNHWMY